jgi:hypothetical protein
LERDSLKFSPSPVPVVGIPFEGQTMKKLKAARDLFLGLWASLPHQVQAGFILFGTVAGTTLAKEFQALIFGTANFTRSTLQHDLGMAVTAGIIAVRTFYMFPNRPDADPVSAVSTAVDVDGRKEQTHGE